MTSSVRDRLKFTASSEAASLLNRLRAFLQKRNTSCYVVGGFIRDGLIGRPNTDIDVVVPGDAMSAASEYAGFSKAKIVPLDEANQVARVILDRSGKRWYLDFAAMRGSIEDDLRARDFTINAMAVDLAEAGDNWANVHVIDPTGGQEDIRARLVRAVSDVTFQNDPARLLRAVRMAAILDFGIESNTESLVRRDAHLISSVSGERLRDELAFILETSRAYKSLSTLDDLGLLSVLIPELNVTRGIEQPKEHYWDVFNHSMETVRAIERILEKEEGREQDPTVSLVPFIPEVKAHFSQKVGGILRSALLKLAGLLHDIAKPSTKTIEVSGRMRFFGHSREGAGETAQLMRRLRFSNRHIRIVETMVEHHLRPGFLMSGGIPSRRAIYRYFRDTGESGIDTLYLSLADHLAARGPELELDEWRRHCELTQFILSKWFEEQSVVAPPKLIDGNVLIKKFGLQPGPRIGELLESVREAQASGEIHTRKEALDLVAQTLEKEAGESQ